MINEISNANEQQGQVSKPGSRHKDIEASGMQTGKSGEFDVRDVVEISHMKPVQAVTEDKNQINFSPDAKNAEKNTYGSEIPEGTAKTAQGNEPAINGTSSVYGERDSGLGKFIDKVV